MFTKNYLKYCILLAVLYFATPNPLASQELGVNEDRPEKYFKMDFSIGPNFDLMGARNSPEAQLLAERPAVVPTFAFRTTHLFSDKWGWFAGIRLDMSNDKSSEYMQNKVLHDFMQELFKPIFFMKYGAEAGLLYRIEAARWTLHPGAGLGFASYVHAQQSTRSRSVNAQKEDWSYQQKASFISLNLGLAANYFVSRRGYFMLVINYQNPLSKSSASYLHRQNGTVLENLSYSTIKAGRNMHLGLGYGFILGSKK